MRATIAIVLAGFGVSCAATTVDPGSRAVTSAQEELVWRAATAAELPGLWRTRSIDGAAAAVLLDVTYWIDSDGSFSGAALFAGPPPAYQVLSGVWALGADGLLHLGDDAEPARAEVSSGLLRLSGEEGNLVLERADIR